MSNSIPISGLSGFSNIETGDFIALVESSSMTTYRTSVQGMFDFMAITASCLSSSHAVTSSYSISSSHSQVAITASNADSASTAVSASYALASSNSTTASWSDRSGTSASSSWASASLTSATSSVSLVSQTASYLLYDGFINGTASFAISASWAQQSATASYALSIPTSGPVTVGGTVPIGTIVDYAGASISDPNWMVCDGSAISRATYADLFTTIGTTWGAGDTVSTFNIPDLRKRLTLGARGSLVDNVYNPGNPGIGGSMLSGAVGNSGGGEAYQYHYHIMTNGDIQVNNDDFHMSMIGFNASLSAYRMFPSRTLTGGAPTTRTWPLYFVTGTSSGRKQPNAYGGDTTNTSTHLCTSFAVNEVSSNWFACPVYPNDWQGSKDWGTSGASAPLNYNRVDLAMPYAVVNKIIRVL